MGQVDLYMDTSSILLGYVHWPVSWYVYGADFYLR